jgi:tetratricopeptide (TPR) repeat protein
MVVESIPSSEDPGNLQAARKLLPHARMAASRYNKMRGVANIELELHQIAYFMEDWESSQEVEGLYVRALKGYEEVWGPKHTSTLGTVNNLAGLYKNQGKMKEAEEMYVRALKGYEEAWGPKHTSTLDIVFNLGNFYRDKGVPAKARQMYDVMIVNAPSVGTLLVCGCHFSFAAVMTCTCLPSLNMYLLLAQIDNNNNDINAHFGDVHHLNNI